MAFFEQENQATYSEYQRKLIKDLQMNDEGVYLIGKAENKNPSEEFDLNDGTGKVRVRNIPENIDNVEIGKYYRVLGQMSLDGSGARFLAVDHIKMLPEFDLNTYQEVLGLKTKMD